MVAAQSGPLLCQVPQDLLTTLSIEGLGDGTVLTGGHSQHTVIAIGPAVTAAHWGVLTPRATTGADGRGRWTSG